jgi:two-component system sensor kinase FixL
MRRSAGVSRGQIVRRLREFVARGEVEKSVEDLPALIEEASHARSVGRANAGSMPGSIWIRGSARAGR